MKMLNIMIRPIVELFCFIQRWRESKDCDEIPAAFHNAFNRTLEQIQEHEEIQQQWKEVWHSKEKTVN